MSGDGGSGNVPPFRASGNSRWRSPEDLESSTAFERLQELTELSKRVESEKMKSRRIQSVLVSQSHDERGSMKTAMQQLRSTLDGTRSIVHRELMKARTWEQVEGSPLPLGSTWMEEEQAFNFAICAEHAESVTLLFYAPPELVVPAFVYRFDFLAEQVRTGSGTAGFRSQILASAATMRTRWRERISWHSQLRPAEGPARPVCESVFFPPEFDRTAAMREGSNAGRAPSGC